MMLGEICKQSAPIGRPTHSLQVVLITAGVSASSPPVVSCHFHLKMLVSSGLLSKDVKIRIYKTITLPVILYGCEIWSDIRRKTTTEGV
jgi:hypothetical protein